MTELVRKDASASNGGELTTGAQTIAGAKTYSGIQTFQQPISGFVAGNDYRNLIINGNMEFQQRGNALTSNTTYNYGIDRFAWFRNGVSLNTPVLTRDTDVPTVTQSGFQSAFSYKLVTNVTGASPGVGELYYIAHKVEGFDYQQIHTKNVRFQFWIKATLAGSYSVVFTNSAYNRSYVATYTINAANTWEKKVIDLQMDTTGTWLFDNGRGLEIQWPLAVTSDAKTTSSTNQWLTGQFSAAAGQTNFAGTSSQSLWLSQVALIPGSFASTVDLPHVRAGRTISDELSMCMRYCEKVTGPIGSGASNAAGAFSIMTTFKVEKRATPILSQSGNVFANDGSAQTAQTYTSATTSTSGGYLIQSVNMTAFRGIFAYTGTANGSDFILWSAEL